VGIDVVSNTSTHMPNDPNFWLDPKKGELGQWSDNFLYDVTAAKQLMEAAGYAGGIDLPMWGQAGVNTDRINLILDEYKRFGLIRVNLNLLPTRDIFYNNIVYQLTPFKGVMADMSIGAAGNDVDYIFQRLYESTGDSCSYGDAKLDQIIHEQRSEVDPVKRAGMIKDFQMRAAEVFPVVPSHSNFAGWSFSWPWLHNVNQPGNLQWLDSAMPKRNG
jgi:ABC-type transport system substrate-binding protein